MEIKKLSNNKVIKLKYKNIVCANCKKRSVDPFTPFCSKKCSDLDLLKWLSNESYVDFQK